LASRQVFGDSGPKLSEIRQTGDSHPVHKPGVSYIQPLQTSIAHFVFLEVTGPGNSLSGHAGNIYATWICYSESIIEDGVGYDSAWVCRLGWVKESAIDGNVSVKIGVSKDWFASFLELNF
jgi:hypothetical protein